MVRNRCVASRMGFSLVRPSVRDLSATIAAILVCMSAPACGQNIWEGDVSSDVTEPANWSDGITQPQFGDTLINAGSPAPAVWGIGATPAPSSAWTDTTNWYLTSFTVGSGAGEFGTLTVNALPGQTNASTRVTSGHALAVGTAGGTGTVTLNLRTGTDPGANLMMGSDQGLGLAVGTGTGSSGTVNVLGSGKSTQSQSFGYPGAGLLQVMGNNNLVGAQGGTGVVNVQDAAWAITDTGGSTPAPPLGVGVNSGSVGTVNVLAGGKLTVNPFSSQLVPSNLVGAEGGTGTVNVQGRNAGGYASNAVFGGGLDVGAGTGSTGSLNVLAGGKALNFSNANLYDPGTGALAPTPQNRLGLDGGSGSALVSGADSIWYVGGAAQPGATPDNPITDGSQLGHLHVGVSGIGELTIADGGVVTLGTAYVGSESDDTSSWYALTDFEDGLGTLYLGETATGTGTLNVGARVGEAPAAPGSLRAAQILFGPGTGMVSFNHTSNSHYFETPLVGPGTLVNRAGITYLVPATAPPPAAPTDNSGFTGITQLYGGGLGLTYSAALGTSGVQVLGSSSLIYGDAVVIANLIAVDPGAVLDASVLAPTSATQAGVVSGGGVLSKTGGGTLSLTGINTLTGETRVTEGVLALAGGGSLADSSRVVADAIFDVSATTAATSIRTLSGVGLVNLGGSELRLSAAADTFAGTITGTGRFSVAAGSEILTGASTAFSGRVMVDGGELWVNGSVGAATSTAQVNTGARLGGGGTLGGSVTVGDGGTLAPGIQADVPGVLTVGGDLLLAPAATLEYDFGEAGVVGGAYNDLLDVGGNLRLDGTLNVTQTPGGAFHPGLYRVISYGGVLDDQELQLGTVPATGLFVSTAIPGQVNLVLAPPLPPGPPPGPGLLDIWDGDAGPKNDGVINGGNGVWQSSLGNDNWTDINGSVNAPFADGGFAIFAAQPGQVRVDNGLGAVSAIGMQFASDGYQVFGDAITLLGPASIIRVGDGTLEGEQAVATINAELVGASELVKADLGTLVLGGSNTYTGGTRVFRGTLQVSRDANLGAGSGGLAFDVGTLHTTASFATTRPVSVGVRGTINVDPGTTFSVDAPVSGSGQLVKTGPGTLLLVQGGPLSGETRVAQGSLVVDGQLGASAVSVGATAMLAGHGTVGATVMEAGSTIAPGNSIGTLTVEGNYLQGAGATYDVEVDPASDQSDRIAINGASLLESGAVLDVTQIPASGPLPDRVGVRYTVLSTSDGLTGTYTLSGDLAVSAFTSLVDVYDANNAYLQVMQVRDFVDVACSPNQTATAGALQDSADDNEARLAVLGLADAAAACNAFGQLSGEVFASVRTVFLEDSRFLREAVGARLRSADVGGTGDMKTVEDDRGLWGHAFGSWGEFRGNPGVSDLDRDIGGFFVGVDGTLAEQWRLGLLGGYSRSSFDVRRLSSSGSSNDMHLGAYAGSDWQHVSVQLGAAYTWHDVSTQRNVAFPGYSERLEADFDASTRQLFASLGYRWSAGSLELQPFLSAAYVQVDVEGSSERGGAAALSARSGDFHTTFSTLGLRASTAFAAGDDRWRWQLMAGWRHAFGSLEPSAWLAFNTGPSFSVTGVPIERNVMALDFGVEGRLSPTTDIGITYSGQMGNHSEDHGAKAYFSWRF